MVRHTLRSIEAHVGGQPLRLIVDGFPRPPGGPLARQLGWLKRHADPLRRAALLEPRGHHDLTAAVLTEPQSPGSDAGLLFLDAAGYPAMSGHGVVAAATIAIERGLFFSRDHEEGRARLVFDTPAGTVAARARVAARPGGVRVDAVSFTNVPSFVHAAALPVKVGPRELRVDVAYGGVFHAMVDTEAIGIPLVASRLPDLRRLGVEILAALNASPPQHPVEPSAAGVAAVIFTGPPQDVEAHLRSVTVSRSGAVDRSACGTASSALMAVLEAMGLLPEEGPFVHEGIAGSLLRGRALRRTIVGDLPALVTEIEGTAWIVGDSTLYVDDEDPLHEGFTV